MNGVTVLDAGVLISYLNADDAHHQNSVRALGLVVRAGGSFATSSVTFSEALVRPARESEGALRRAYSELKFAAGIDVLEVDLDVAVEIARARARHSSLKTPDAAVLATARSENADRILTTDDRLARFDEAVLVRDFNG